eukprot:COSAG06_NODE_3152_length_5767_cov_9.071101_5_plen_140_part_00
MSRWPVRAAERSREPACLAWGNFNLALYLVEVNASVSCQPPPPPPPPPPAVQAPVGTHGAVPGVATDRSARLTGGLRRELWRLEASREARARFSIYTKFMTCNAFRVRGARCSATMAPESIPIWTAGPQFSGLQFSGPL